MQKVWRGLGLSVLLGISMIVVGQATYASSGSLEGLADRIIATTQADVHPQESLVQWYYVVANLSDQLSKDSKNSTTKHTELQELKKLLRTHLNKQKSDALQQRTDEFRDRYNTRLVGRNDLNPLCVSLYELADDRSFALNLPTALTIAVLDMESSCRMANPNRDGVFQLTANDYEPGVITTGHRISQLYDFNDFVHRNRARYHSSNKLDIEDCPHKDTALLGQTAPICLSYASMDLDSLIKFGALYNGLKSASIKGDIQPSRSEYVYGFFDQDHMTGNKEGMLVRVLQALQYERSLESK